MEPTRSALIVASETYEDPQLAQLRAPGRDAAELATVLRDPAIGGFDVHVSMNQHHYEVRIALEDFFANRAPDDLLLLHFSCHGIKDEAGRLFFAAADTQRSRLNATAIAADYVNDLLNHARSRRVVLLLDCCFSGAFTRGMLARGGQTLDVVERFGGRGRAVLTASGALEYAWEGDALTHLNEPSIFTSAVVHGLRSGEADRDGDQQVSVDDLYDYVYEVVRSRTPNQTPGKWSDVEGTLIIARSPERALPADLQEAVDDGRSWVRAAVVGQLAGLRRGSDRALALAASQALHRLALDGSKDVSTVAERALRNTLPGAPGADDERVFDNRASADQSQEVSRLTLLPPPSWMPALVIGGGWIAAWLSSFALATSAWVTDMAAVTLALVGWIITAPLVALGLRWATQGRTRSPTLLVGLGWPVCIAVGLGVPIALRLSHEGAALLGIGVAVAGLLAAVALTRRGEQIPWDRVLAVDAGWCAGWLWSGATAWPQAFGLLADGYASTVTGVLDTVPFVQLAAGGVLSGVAGGVLMWLLLRETPSR